MYKIYTTDAVPNVYQTIYINFNKEFKGECKELPGEYVQLAPIIVEDMNSDSKFTGAFVSLNEMEKVVVGLLDAYTELNEDEGVAEKYENYAAICDTLLDLRDVGLIHNNMDSQVVGVIFIASE